jgi:hypothetical protein
MAQAMADTSTSRTAPLRDTTRIAAASAFDAASVTVPPPVTEPNRTVRSEQGERAQRQLVGSGRVGSVQCLPLLRLAIPPPPPPPQPLLPSEARAWVTSRLRLRGWLGTPLTVCDCERKQQKRINDFAAYRSLIRKKNTIQGV